MSAPTVNKTELSRKVAEKMDGTLQQGSDALTAVLDSMTDLLCEGCDINLVGFAAFKLQNRAARKGRNPQTGAVIDIPESTTVRMKVGKVLKERLND